MHLFSKRSIFIVGLMILMSLILTSCGNDSDKTNTKDVTFGVLYPETGGLASPGASSKAALDLAVQDINNYFQTKNNELRIRLSYKDTKGDSQTALAKIKEFYNEGIKTIIGPYTSDEISAVREYANLNDMILLGWGSTAPSLGISNDNLIRFIPTDVLQAAAISQKMYEKGVTAVIGLNRNDVWGNDFINQMKSALPNYNITYIDGISYPAATSDFSSVISSLNSKVTTTQGYYSADSIAVILISYEEAAPILNAANSYTALQNTKWFGCDGNYGLIDFTAYPTAGLFGASSKVSFTASCYLTAYNAGDTPQVSSFLPSPTQLNSRIAAITGTSEGNDYYMIAYDMLWIASLAYNQTADPANINSFKKSISNVASDTYVGVNGQIVFNSAGDRTTGGYGYFKVVPNGGSYKWEMDSVYKKYAINKTTPSSPINNQSSNVDNSDSIIFVEIGTISNVMTSQELDYYYYWWWDYYYYYGNYDEESYYNAYTRLRLNMPQGVTLDDTGNVYITDAGLSRVVAINNSGLKIAEWGTFGNASDTNLIFPAGISVGNNICYVADRDSNVIKKYDLSGNYLGQYGLYGSALGEFNKPAKLFFDAFTSNLFAIDLSNNRIQYKDGADVWRSFVSGNEPISIASDNSCFYVLTRGNYKVTKYDRTDTSVTNQFGNYGMGSGQFLYPIDMTILNDSIVVLDNYSIQMFDNSGASKFKWNSYGRLKNPTSIAADNNQGYVYVTDAGKNAVKIYKMYNNADIIVYSFNNGSQPDSWPMKIARDPKNGFVYVATYSYYYDNIADEDHYRECIIKMNASMQNVLAIWGSADEYDAEASDLGNFANITNITTDKDGNLYVSESSPNYRIQKLAAGSNAWTLFAGGNGSGPADTQFQFVACISSDSQGNIYAFDRYLNRLSKYSSAGTLLNTTNLDYLYDNGYIDEALRYFTVSNNGNFYFLSTYASKVLVLNSNLQYVSQWGGYGFENEKFLWPIDIKSDSEGNIYVLDSDNSRISKFDSTGNFLKKWGTYGFDKLQFAYPYGIDVNNNYIWVADADNCRIQKFRQ